MKKYLLAIASLSLALIPLAKANGPIYSGNLACTPTTQNTTDNSILIENLGTPNARFSVWEGIQLPKGAIVRNPVDFANLIRSRRNEFQAPDFSMGSYNPAYRSKNPNFPGDMYNTQFSWDGGVSFIFSKAVNAPANRAPNLATRITGEGFSQDTYNCIYL